MKPPEGALERVGDWLGTEFSAPQAAQLEAFAAWLVEEAVELGGIGPDEPDRIWDRHVLDSVVFSCDLSPGAVVLDVGSGVGLPGIPLAVVHPGSVTLLDRSARRVDALHRAAAVLELDVSIVHDDASFHTGQYDRLVFRGSLPLPAARAVLPRLCAPDGCALFGLGRGAKSPAVAMWKAGPPVQRIRETLIAVPSGVLDSPAWLLRMAPP